MSQRFDGEQGKCGIEIHESGEIEVFSDCCGCGDEYTEEVGLKLTRALMERYGIKEG